jgi:ribonuclease HI
MESLHNIKIFTDGSSLNNSGIVSYGGIGIYFPNNEFKNISESFFIKPITNQRTELYAIYVSLKKVIDSKMKFKKIKIYTDSEYSINSLTVWINNWKKNDWKGSNNKPIKNRDIIEPISKLIEKYPDKIKFTHVRSHTGGSDFNSINNNRADKLAVSGARKAQKLANKKTESKTLKIKVNTIVDDSKIDVTINTLDNNQNIKIQKNTPVKKKTRIKINI